MKRTKWILSLLLPLGVSIWGQELTFSPVSSKTPSIVQMALMLTSARDKQPVALQWDLSYASPKLGMEEEDLVIGTAPKSARKFLTCAGSAKDAGIYVYRCILAGGSDPIPIGPIVFLSFHIRPYARPGLTPIRISNTLGVLADGSRVEVVGHEIELR